MKNIQTFLCNFLVWCVLLALSGCNMLESVQNIGGTPPLTRTQDPTAYKDYKPVEMPMPYAHPPTPHNPNSLWRPGARAFFKDQRASRVGDIVTVVVHFSDQATLTSSGSLSRKSSFNANAKNFLGLGKIFEEDILPKKAQESLDPNSLLSFGSSPTQKSDGSITRKESANFKVAAVITQILPNGNLVITGRQEFRFNLEVRELLITGVLRPQDILADNTISYEKIGEARFSYGGRGTISDAQQEPWGQKILSVASPF